MKKKNAFTLIELITVLVILAIIALIVTPLVLNIVKKAKDSANKRSVDAYGKAVELAVATYLLDTGNYPTTLDNLTVEYSGNEVICNVKTLNEDGSIYLSECTVKGIEVKDSKTDDGWYHYGKTTSNVVTYDIYTSGDQVTYNGMDFYVIANSDETSESVTLLKAEPLTVDEVNKYGVGHINKYTYSNQGTASDGNGYGGMAYYSSSTCGYNGSIWVEDGCTTDYEQSDVKYAVDTWMADKFDTNDLTEDILGYKTRLLTVEELTTNLGYMYVERETSSGYDKSSDTPIWVYNSNYRYWTMNQYKDSVSSVWLVSYDGDAYNGNVYFQNEVIRPVVTLLKSGNYLQPFY